MASILLSLGLGAGAIVALDLALHRYGRLGTLPAAGLAILPVLGIYLPFALQQQHGADVLAVHLAVYLLAALGCSLVLSARTDGTGSKPGWHWAPLALTGFFVVLTALLAMFIVIAERGLSPAVSAWLLPGGRDEKPVSLAFPGVIAHDFQKKETLYNDYLQQIQRQEARGWQIRKGWLRQPVAGETAVFRVAAQTRDGTPLTGAVVRGRFMRPSDSRLDADFSLAEAGSGIYETELQLPVAGNWDLVLQVQKDGELHEIRGNTAVLDR